MINKTDVERIRLRYQLSSIYPDNHVTELCDYWLEQNKEKKIEKLENLTGKPFFVTNKEDKILNLVVENRDKLNEIIDVINEMREGR